MNQRSTGIPLTKAHNAVIEFYFCFGLKFFLINNQFNQSPKNRTEYRVLILIANAMKRWVFRVQAFKALKFARKLILFFCDEIKRIFN